MQDSGPLSARLCLRGGEERSEERRLIAQHLAPQIIRLRQRADRADARAAQRNLGRRDELE